MSPRHESSHVFILSSSLSYAMKEYCMASQGHAGLSLLTVMLSSSLLCCVSAPRARVLGLLNLGGGACRNPRSSRLGPRHVLRDLQELVRRDTSGFGREGNRLRSCVRVAMPVGHGLGGVLP